MGGEQRDFSFSTKISFINFKFKQKFLLKLTIQAKYFIKNFDSKQNNHVKFRIHLKILEKNKISDFTGLRP